jgi:hypothetical protein
MPSKLVYVSDQHYGSTDALDVLSPKQLDALLEQGFEIIKRSKRTIDSPKTKKQVKVDYLELATKSAERSITASKKQPREAALVDDNDLGNRRSVAIRDSGSYLGSGSDFHDIITAGGKVGITAGASSQLAYGMGVDCAKTGGFPTECPFDAGTKPYEEWQKGFVAGGGNMPAASPAEALDEARALGATAARGPKELEVSCPYPVRTDLYDAWVSGFEKAGGTIE